MNLIVDNNIVFYLLGGNRRIKSLLNKTTVHIPFIVEIELLSHPKIKTEELKLIRSFINDSIRIPYSDQLKESVIEVRKSSKIKIPDAFVAASSLITNYTLVSADTDFRKVEDLNFIEFNLS